jgi:hypothetical protein
VSAADRPPDAPQPEIVTSASELAAHTQAFAARVFDAVATEYLTYRRIYHHESEPSISTLPATVPDAQVTEGARLAQGALRIMPKEAHAVPLARDLLDHLQWVVDIHTLTQHERVQLHNLTMTFLYGVTNGIQGWYVEWLLLAAHKLQDVTHPKYYLAYPWQALLYRPPDQLAAFTAAVRGGSVAGIEREVQRMADQLVAVLRDPLGTQPKLAFGGRDGDRRKLVFDLKTAAGLALGAYLAAETVRTLTRAGPEAQIPPSVIGLPDAMVPHVVPDDATPAQ